MTKDFLRKEILKVVETATDQAQSDFKKILDEEDDGSIDCLMGDIKTSSEVARNFSEAWKNLGDKK